MLVLQVQQVMVSGCEVKNNLISLTFGKRVTHTSLSCFITKDQIVCSNRPFSPESMMYIPIKNRSRDSEERVSNCLEVSVNVQGRTSPRNILVFPQVPLLLFHQSYPPFPLPSLLPFLPSFWPGGGSIIHAGIRYQGAPSNTVPEKSMINTI